MNTLTDLFHEACHQFPNHVAFSCMGASLSFAELAQHAHAFAAYCQHIGLQKGDRLAIMLPNILSYPVAFWGALLAGLTVVNLNPLDKAPSLKHELGDAQAKALVVLEQFTGELQSVLPETAIQHVLIASMGDLHPLIPRLLINTLTRYLKRATPTWSCPTAHTFQAALKRGSTLSFVRPSLLSSDLALLQYTGGTTGLAKGVMLSHANIVSNVLQVQQWTNGHLQPGREVILTALPLYHIFSLVVNLLLFCSIGGKNILIPDPRNIPRLVRTIQKSLPTCLTGVNTLFNALLHNPAFRAHPPSSLKVVIGGGMAVQQSVAEEWQRVTGTVLIQGYGLTETSPVVTVNPLDASHFTGSIGQALPDTDISIQDEQGQILPPSTIGEICVKGPQVMQGYAHQPEATAHALRDGWLHTDDAGYRDEAGFFYLVDRLKDMIIVSGFNVYPAEVENQLKMLPGINEVAVVGVPNPEHGEVIKAFIVLEKNATLTQQAIFDYCHRQLAAYKCPHEIEFMDALPKSPVGKILKRTLQSK